MQVTGLDAADDSDPTVEDLRPETIDAVADRTARSSGFSELVYRECEINALWSLADIALTAAFRRSGGGTAAHPPSRLARLRELFEEAYRLLACARNAEASQVLARAAALSAAGS